MEISLQMNTNIAKMAPMLNKVKYSKLKAHNNYKLETTISCRAAADHGGLAMHKKKSNNFYEVLSLGSENNIQNVGLHEIKKAYRSMARQFHPDICPTSAKEESTRKFIELQKAYETLSDPILRQKYDYQLGLADSRQFGVDGCSMDEVKISIHRREVWEEQLSGLRKKSQVRMKKKKHKKHESI